MAAILFTTHFLEFVFCTHNIEFLCHDRRIYLFFSFVVSLVIVLVDKLKYFGYISFVSTVIILLALISITIINIVDISKNGFAVGVFRKFEFKNMFNYFGLVLYAIEGIGLILPNRSSYQDK